MGHTVYGVCATESPDVGSCSRKLINLPVLLSLETLIHPTAWYKLEYHCQFHIVNVRIFHLQYEYVTRSESLFACYSRCYVTGCPLATEIVASQCPWARDAAPVTRYFTPLISACLNRYNEFCPNTTYSQLICKHNSRLPSPSLLTRLLDTGHM